MAEVADNKGAKASATQALLTVSTSFKEGKSSSRFHSTATLLSPCTSSLLAVAEVFGNGGAEVVATRALLTVSTSIKEGKSLSRWRASMRPTLEADEFINLLEGERERERERGRGVAVGWRGSGT